MKLIMETKVCSICGKELPLSEFYPHKNSKDGYNAMCKFCHKERVHKAAAERKRLKAIAAKGGKQLSDYTPRELMEELYRRGYKGTLEFVEVKRIDLSKL